ncbi:MAG: extracellular solute-binding protein [Chloroflexi bacterium]|nr:extracellular solute-binding protein [Chloroflexota bacterium]
MPTVELRGVSWDHPRGHDCMVATAEAYAAVQPEVRVVWETRSLQDFADFPVQKLAEIYDLLVIDHPFVGFAAADGCLLPLDEHIDAAVLADQAANSVGPSHRSYLYGGHQWALATDAAGHVAAYRPDLLAEIGGLPRTWDDVLAVAEARRNQERARVANPLIPIDSLMSFCSICAAAGEPPYAGPERVVSRSTGRQALGMLKALRAASHPASPSRNPPRLLDLMSTTDEIAYIPLLFGYSNYARPGFRPSLIRFTGVPTFDGGESRGGILGGAGLAISASTRHPTAAAAYAAYVASPDVQRGVYFTAGGQPGHRAAWCDAAVNAASSDFFQDTLAALDRAYLRPRYLGFMEVQERSGELIHKWLAGEGSAEGLLDRLDDLYRKSEPGGKE